MLIGNDQWSLIVMRKKILLIALMSALLAGIGFAMVRFKFLASIPAPSSPDHSGITSKASTTEANENTKINIQLNEGGYLRKSYLDHVYATHSDLVDMSFDGLIAAGVSVKNGRSSIMWIWNFHEGDATRWVRGDGNLYLDDERAEVSDKYQIRVISNHEFEIVNPKEYAGKFVRVEGFDQEIRNATIAGSYVDENGQRYRFNVLGVARFPDKAYEYTITLDHIEHHFDSIQLGNELMKYERHQDDLILTKLKSEGFYEPEDKPFLRLKRVGD
jgi:hypothetical protein